MGKAAARPVGLTRDSGYQIGVRRTLPIRADHAWALLTSPEGARVWLGTSAELHFAEGERFQLPDGASGEIRVFSPNSHLRMTWQPPGWERASLLQLRVIPKGDHSVVAFHQEHLPGGEAREDRRRYYLDVLRALERLIEAG